LELVFRSPFTGGSIGLTVRTQTPPTSPRKNSWGSDRNHKENKGFWTYESDGTLKSGDEDSEDSLYTWNGANLLAENPNQSGTWDGETLEWRTEKNSYQYKWKEASSEFSCATESWIWKDNKLSCGNIYLEVIGQVPLPVVMFLALIRDSEGKSTNAVPAVKTIGTIKFSDIKMLELIKSSSYGKYF
jgi:hypothetical protein